MRKVPENLPHLYAEGIEYSESPPGETSYPGIVEYAAGALDKLAEDFEAADHEDSVLHLYRGDSKENLEELGSVDLDSLELTGDLRKDFPLYFTTSEAEARDHAQRKPTEDRYLLKLEAPFENLDRIRGFTPREVAKHYDQIDFQENTMYFNQSNTTWDSLEWISTDIPQEWVTEIEELD